MALLSIETDFLAGTNFVAGRATRGSGAPRQVLSPYTASAIGSVVDSTADDVHSAVAAAHAAAKGWAETPLPERLQPLSRLRALLLDRLEPLSIGIAAESGKTPDEAKAGLLRGIEVIDFALALPHRDTGAAKEVSRGVSCEYRRQALGVVCGITPFNFPAMVPMWMFPLALSVGNAFILKPSEKVPLTACRLAELMSQAGFPPGVFSVVHGAHQAAASLVTHPLVRAVGFVGSSNAAQAVYSLAAQHGKRALCLGGAKNLIAVAPDADLDLAARAIVDSFTGCAGQRCMAASVLVLIGDGARVLDRVVARARELRIGETLGALIDESARTRLHQAIALAEQQGARVVLDGRQATIPMEFKTGYFLGPTVLDQVRPEMPCAKDELFGPVLSVLRVDHLDAALELERSGAYGNAFSIFTSSGAVATAVRERATSGMLGVNVGVPVPREPFSFGGTKLSKFGHGDITGPGGVDFWSDLKKVTMKWQPQSDGTWMS